jgi:hypothetical protein
MQTPRPPKPLNRTRDLPVWSAVPQPLRHRVPHLGKDRDVRNSHQNAKSLPTGTLVRPATFVVGSVVCTLAPKAELILKQSCLLSSLNIPLKCVSLFCSSMWQETKKILMAARVCRDVTGK